MLHELFNNKLKEAFRNASFEPSEDSLSSSVFGLLQYLPAQTMWDLLRQSCGNSSLLPVESGELQNIDFWPDWSAEGKDITNKDRVQPDIFCEFDNFYLIVEAKRNGNQSKQCKRQWKNEINAFLNEFYDRDKTLIFIAIGGNETFKSQIIPIRGGEQDVFSASWQNLLNAIDKRKKECSNHEQRILSDIIQVSERHGISCMEWLETLGYFYKISEESMKTVERWSFGSIKISSTETLSTFYKNNSLNININSKNIIKSWQTY